MEISDYMETMFDPVQALSEDTAEYVTGILKQQQRTCSVGATTTLEKVKNSFKIGILQQQTFCDSHLKSQKNNYAFPFHSSADIYAKENEEHTTSADAEDSFNMFNYEEFIIGERDYVITPSTEEFNSKSLTSAEPLTSFGNTYRQWNIQPAGTDK